MEKRMTFAHEHATDKEYVSSLETWCQVMMAFSFKYHQIIPLNNSDWLHSNESLN